MRDTANDIHETATELKESGVTGEIARSIEVTSKAAQDTIQTVRDTAKQIGAAPKQPKQHRRELKASKKNRNMKQRK